MTEWGVVLVIISLVGLGAAVIKPILTLNSLIVELSAGLKQLGKELEELNRQNGETHKRIWGRIDDHEERLLGYEQRISHLEYIGRS